MTEVGHNWLVSFDDWLAAELPSVHGAVHEGAEAVSRVDRAGAPYAHVVNHHLHRIVSGQLLADMVSGMFQLGAETKRAADCFVFEDHYAYRDTSFAGCFPETARVIERPSLLFRNNYLDADLWRDRPVAAFNSVVESMIGAGLFLLCARMPGGGPKTRPTFFRPSVRRPTPLPTKPVPMAPAIDAMGVRIAPTAVRHRIAPGSFAAIEGDLVTVVHRGEAFAFPKTVWRELVRTRNITPAAMDAMALELRHQSGGVYFFNRTVAQSQALISESMFGDVQMNVRRAIKRNGGTATVTILGDGSGAFGAWLKEKLGERVAVRNISLWPADAANAAAYDLQLITDVRALRAMPWASDVIIDIYGPAFHVSQTTPVMLLRGLNPEGQAFFITRNGAMLEHLQVNSTNAVMCGQVGIALGMGIDLPMRSAEMAFAGSRLQLVMPHGSTEIFVSATREAGAVAETIAHPAVLPLP